MGSNKTGLPKYTVLSHLGHFEDMLRVVVGSSESDLFCLFEVWSPLSLRPLALLSTASVPLRTQKLGASIQSTAAHLHSPAPQHNSPRAFFTGCGKFHNLTPCLKTKKKKEKKDWNLVTFHNVTSAECLFHHFLFILPPNHILLVNYDGVLGGETWGWRFYICFAFPE